MEQEPRMPITAQDPRGPFRTVASVERTPEAHLVRFVECDHIARQNPTMMAPREGEQCRCFHCRSNPNVQTKRPDEDELDRVCDALCARYGNLEVSTPDANGSVRIVCHEASKSWRFTSQGLLLAGAGSGVVGRLRGVVDDSGAKRFEAQLAELKSALERRS
jgi:hypothetical protein